MGSGPYRFFALLVRPLCWPRWIRRASLLLLPLAVPCWLVLLMLVPVGEGLAELGGVIAKFWNGQQRYLYRRDRYAYDDAPGTAGDAPDSAPLAEQPHAEWTCAVAPAVQQFTDTALIAQRAILMR